MSVFFQRQRVANLILVWLVILLISGCEGSNSDPSFEAGFSYEHKEGNIVRFYNDSEGEYYSLLWDFGNGDTTLTTDKKREYEIYYPLAGDYDVSLKVMDFTGNSKTVSKTITIARNDLVISFNAVVDPANPNYVELENTTTGEYDSFTWIYRMTEVENEMVARAYFPFAGNYEIELRILKGSHTFSLKKSVTILADDPDYVRNMMLVWSDEFEGSTVNPDYWSYETGASGWGNNELQNYTDGDNVDVRDGKLIITARKVNDNKEVGSYTSARLVTKGKKEFTMGRMEIRAKLPSGTGIWAAIWMLGSNFTTAIWPECGEIDIMEYVGYEPNTIHSTVHTLSGYGISGNGSSKELETCEEEFHVYGLLWTEEEILFYTDTTTHVTHTYAPTNKTAENWPFTLPQFFIFNVAVGGDWGGAQGIDNSIFPQSMEIDYIRVYQ